MGLRPDFERTATGWVWLDKLTAPYWRWADHREEQRFDATLGITGTRAERDAERHRLFKDGR